MSARGAMLPPCLVGAGFLGHTWIVTVLAADGSERIYLQACRGEDAVRVFDEAPAASAIYTRKGKSWRRVSRAAAAIA